MKRVCEGTKDTHKDIYVWSKEAPACIVRQNTKILHLYLIANTITDEFKPKGNLAYKTASIITKLVTGEDFEFHMNWNDESFRRIGLLKLFPSTP
jgi:hypothetical protein